MQTLADVHFADRVHELVRLQSVESRNITLEVTASATTADISHSLENLSRLRMEGFGLSIDDDQFRVCRVSPPHWAEEVPSSSACSM